MITNQESNFGTTTLHEKDNELQLKHTTKKTKQLGHGDTPKETRKHTLNKTSLVDYSYSRISSTKCYNCELQVTFMSLCFKRFWVWCFQSVFKNWVRVLCVLLYWDNKKELGFCDFGFWFTFMFIFHCLKLN